MSKFFGGHGTHAMAVGVAKATGIPLPSGEDEPFEQLLDWARRLHRINPRLFFEEFRALGNMVEILEQTEKRRAGIRR